MNGTVSGRRLLTMGCSFGALLMALPSTAYAQASTQPTGGTAEAPQLGDIVVTAEHRPSTTQKTPIAISVYSHAELERRDVHDLASLARIAPDVNVDQIGAQAIVTIRGVASRDVSEVGDPAVAISTDGVYLNRSYAFSATLYDLDRVEALRGPQGTLNGRNAVGGAVNIITAKPTKQLEGSASLTYGNYNTLQAEGMINLPISDKVQLRAAFTSRSHDGYRQTPPFGRGDDEDAKSGRVTVAFQPTERLEGSITLQYTHIGGNGQALDFVPFNYDVNGNVLHTKPKFSAKSFPDPVYSSIDLNEKTLRWQFGYDLGFAKLTYLGGYDSIDYHQPRNSGTTTSIDQWNPHEWPKTQNQELRLSSDPADRLTWQTGVYYFREDSHLYSYDGVPTSYSPSTRTDTYAYNTVAQSLAGYAQAGFKIIPTVTISGGVRYTWDRKSRSGTIENPVDTSVLPYSYYTVAAASVKASWTKPTWHAGIDWQATPHNLIYAKFDTGYKAGGFTEISSYGPETVSAWEAGLKNRFFGNTLQINVDGFYETYKNQQVTQLVATSYGSAQNIVNAGASRIYGAEADMAVALPKIGKLSVFAQWLHARFTNFVYETNGVNVQYAGNSLPQAPDLTVGLGLEHIWTTSIGVFTANIQTKMATSQHLTFENYADDRQGFYTMSDFNLDYHPEGARWSVGAYVRNLENSTVLLTADEYSYADAYRYAFMPPRTYGVRLSAKF